MANPAKFLPTVGSLYGARFGAGRFSFSPSAVGDPVPNLKIVTNGDELAAAVSSSAGYEGVYLQGQYFDLTAPLEITVAKPRFSIIGNYATIRPKAGLEAAFDGKPVLAVIGSNRCTFENLTILANAGDSHQPACGLLLARDNTNASAGFHIFTNVHVEGYFSVAALANCASEVGLWLGGNIVNTGNVTGGATAIYTAASVPASITTTTATGTSSNNLVQTFVGVCVQRSRVVNDFDAADSMLKIVNYATDMLFIGGNWSTTNARGDYNSAGLLNAASRCCKAVIDVSMTAGSNIERVLFDGVRFETGWAKTFCDITSDGTNRALNIQFTNNICDFSERFVLGRANVYINRPNWYGNKLTPRAQYDWGYTGDGTTTDTATNAAADRTLVDLYGLQYGEIQLIGIEPERGYQSGTTNDLSADGTTKNAWKALRIRSGGSSSCCRVCVVAAGNTTGLSAGQEIVYS